MRWPTTEFNIDQFALASCVFIHQKAVNRICSVQGEEIVKAKLGAVAAIFLATTSAGYAQDEMLRPHVWNGVYVGAHGGYGWSSTDWTLIRNAGNEPSNQIGSIVAAHDVGDWIGGVQAGANWQNGTWVFGGEAQMSWTGMKGYNTWVANGGPNAGAFRDATTNIDWFVTLAGRAGIAHGKTLFYAKAGLAIAGESYSHTGGSIRTPRFLVGDETRVGWLIGAGIEHALDRNWSIKLEYNYMDFGRDSVSLTDGVRTAIFGIQQDVQTIQVGINYKFNWLGGY